MVSSVSDHCFCHLHLIRLLGLSGGNGVGEVLCLSQCWDLLQWESLFRIMCLTSCTFNSTCLGPFAHFCIVYLTSFTQKVHDVLHIPCSARCSFCATVADCLHREEWRVTHVWQEMLTLSGTPDFASFKGVHSFSCACIFFNDFVSPPTMIFA